jgi:hypothetical protein
MQNKHIALTRPTQTSRGYTVTVLCDDGRTPIASCLPQPTRNNAIVRAWTLANDLRANRI